MVWNSNLNIFLKKLFVGEISNKVPNDLFRINLYKNLKFCWKLLSTILQWTNTNLIISKWGKFWLFLSLVTLFSVLPSNFIVSGVESSRKYPVLILDAILFLILFLYILIEVLSVIFIMLSKIYS